MPVHSVGLVTRRSLLHPEEEKLQPLDYELVKKGNPNHDPKTGRFSSGGSKGSSGYAVRNASNPFHSDIPVAPIPNPHNIPGLETADQHGPYKPALNPAATTMRASNASREASHSPDPIGTIHYSDQTLTPTGKKAVIPSGEPVGTIYNSGQTLVPGENGTYIDQRTGHVYQSNAAEMKARAAADRVRDAAKGAAYVAAFGKKKR